jgi:sporulation protein YlmC with PRC-barrel domain
MKCIMTGLLACGLMMSWTALAPAADTDTGSKIAVPKAYRMNKLRGVEVRNLQGEKLGTVDDFVVNMETGTINYVALGTGGVLGLGEKLFAIPFNEVKMSMDGNNIFFVVNVSKTKLKNSKGFDKDNWPENATAGFAEAVDHNAATPKPNTRQ